VIVEKVERKRYIGRICMKKGNKQKKKETVGVFNPKGSEKDMGELGGEAPINSRWWSCF
jgi:hypothetical protein